ncbi:MAG: type IV pilus modification protein PilV [Steroidobacteraceae bacterium]
MLQKLMCKSINKQSGVGMVEVLVALVVMSVGMLGIASLYVTTLQAKTTSLSRMKAVNLAYDIADRIRANPTAFANYVIAPTDTTTSTDCASASCSAAQIAAADLDQWNTLVNDAITGLPGTVTRSIVQTAAATATTPTVLTINLSWNEVNSGTLSYALQVQI